MIGWNEIGHFRKLSNYREILNHAVKVYSPHTNRPHQHMMHKIPIE